MEFPGGTYFGLEDTEIPAQCNPKGIRISRVDMEVEQRNGWFAADGDGVVARIADQQARLVWSRRRNYLG
jgi:hypothetical protein